MNARLTLNVYAIVVATIALGYGPQAVACDNYYSGGTAGNTPYSPLNHITTVSTQVCTLADRFTLGTDTCGTAPLISVVEDVGAMSATRHVLAITCGPTPTPPPSNPYPFQKLEEFDDTGMGTFAMYANGGWTSTMGYYVARDTNVACGTYFQSPPPPWGDWHIDGLMAECGGPSNQTTYDPNSNQFICKSGLWLHFVCVLNGH
jgi:hypothetical protein